MQDMDLAFEVDRLGANLASAFPEMPWGQPAMGGEGDEPMPLSATVDAMERLHDYEDLDRSMRGDYPGASVDDVDEEALRRILGEPAVRDLRRLKEIERALEKAGLMTRRNGRLEVTPARRAQAGGACAGAGVRGAEARPRGNARGARGGRHGRADRRDAPVAVRRHRADRRAADGVQRGGALRAGAADPAARPTTSSWSRPSSAPRPRPRCCWTSRSACRCAGTSSTRRRWRSRSTR